MVDPNFDENQFDVLITYRNMISNEVFIDSAALLENVVALARNIGYVPQSERHQEPHLNNFVDISSVSPIYGFNLKRIEFVNTGETF